MKRMMIVKDEAYPVYDMWEVDDAYDIEPIVEFTAEEIEEFNSVEKAYNRMQQKLAEKYEEARKANK